MRLPPLVAHQQGSRLIRKLISRDHKTNKLVHPDADGIPQHLYPCILALLEGVEIGASQTQKEAKFSYQGSTPRVLKVNSNSDRLLSVLRLSLARFRLELHPVTG